MPRFILFDYLTLENENKSRDFLDNNNIFAVKSSPPKAANDAFELYRQLNEKKELKASVKPRSLFSKTKKIDLNVQMNGAVYDSYVNNGRALFRSINQIKDLQVDKDLIQDENNNEIVAASEQIENELMEQDVADDQEVSFIYESPSYSPLESPIRDTVKLNNETIMQIRQISDENNNSYCIDFDYLDIFNECINTIDSLLIVEECMEDLLDKVEIEVEKKIQIKPVKIINKANPKGNFNEQIELIDDMKFFFDLNKIEFKNTNFSDIRRKNEIHLKYQSNNIMDQIVAYFRELILCYLSNVNIDCNINEVDIDFVKFQLNAYLKELKSKSSTVEHDSKLIDLIMINSCFMAVDIVANYDFKSFESFFKSFFEKQKKLIENQIQKISSRIDEISRLNFKYHPKFIALCDIIRDKKRKKIIIVINRSNNDTINKISSALLEILGIKVKHINMLDKVSEKSSQCFIADLNKVKENTLMLKSFNLIVEYDFQAGAEESFLQKLAREFDINIVSLENYNFKIRIVSQKENSTTLKRSLIVSSKIIENNFLLNLLENKLKLTVVERNYESIKTTYGLYSLVYADILIDEATGILLFDTNEFFKDYELNLNELRVKLSFLKHQLDFCYIVFISKNCKSNLTNLKIDLHSVISQIKLIKFKIIFLNSQESLSKLLSEICVSEVDAFELELNETLSEIGLLSFCCLNAYSAQRLLSKYEMSDLLTSDYNRLLIEFDTKIPRRFLDMFYKFSISPAEIL